MKQYYILAEREDGSICGFKTDLPIRQFTKFSKFKNLNTTYIRSTKSFMNNHDIYMVTDVLESTVPTTYKIIKRL